MRLCHPEIHVFSHLCTEVMPGLGGFGGGRRRRAIDILMLSVRNAPYKKVLVECGLVRAGRSVRFPRVKESECLWAWMDEEGRESC